MASKKVKVVFFTRKPRDLGNFSIETYFGNIKDHLPSEFQPVWVEMPFYSNGIFKRLANAVYCYLHQGDINHVTGDIHYVAILLRKSKTVLTIHDCGLLHETKGIKHVIFRWFWFTVPVSCVARVTAVSMATKNDIIAFTHCNPDKVDVIHTCIATHFAKRESSFNEVNPRILQIGTAENKNIRRLIPAIKDTPCTLVIVGKVPDDIKELIRVNHISFELLERRLDDVEMLEEYHKSDIVAMVSTLEGFGMPIIEANAVGRVVIAGNNSSMPEIAADAALLVDAMDINAIRQGLLTLIDNKSLRQKLVDNGFKNAERFSPSNLAGKYAEMYHQLVHSNIGK